MLCAKQYQVLVTQIKHNIIESDNHFQPGSILTEINPITAKIQKLIDNGLTREKICVASDMSFYAVRQIFLRNRVSKLAKLSLLKANLITEEDVHEYEKWLRSQAGAKTKRKKRSQKSERDNQSASEL